jgi:flagellum-specific ATP synthase
MDEPVSDTLRGILDGHLILSRNLAQRYHYPAIDVLASISRLANVVSGTETKKAVGIIRRLMADYADSEDLINVGAYRQGSNPGIDNAIAKREDIEKFLIQAVDEKSTVPETLNALGEIAGVEIPEDEMEVYIPKMFFQKEEDDPDPELVETNYESLFVRP